MKQDAGRSLDLPGSIAALVGVIAAIIAGATVWLMLTEPITVTNAVGVGEISPLVHRLAEIVCEAMTSLIDYL